MHPGTILAGLTIIGAAGGWLCWQRYETISATRPNLPASAQAKAGAAQRPSEIAMTDQRFAQSPPPPCGEGLGVGVAPRSGLAATPTPALPTRGRGKKEPIEISPP